MARAKRICSKPGCPHPAITSRCQQHEREHDTARGSRTTRGYGPAHIRLRSQWAAAVNAGQARCARCGQPIQPDQPWHLDHRDDRTGYLGASHAQCNQSAAGKASRGPTPGG